MGEIYRGNSAISAIYRGQSAVSNVYRGQTEIWSAVTPYTPPQVLIDNGIFFYDASATSDFTDQTANGNDGTVQTAGSSGNAGVTHYDTATPYWDWTNDNDGKTKQAWLDCGSGTGTDGNTQTFSLAFIYKRTKTATNNDTFFVRTQDGSNDNLTVIDRRATNSDKFFRVATGTRYDIDFSPNFPTDFTLYYLTSTPTTYSVYENNTLLGTKSFAGNLNLSANFIWGWNNTYSNPSVIRENVYQCGMYFWSYDYEFTSQDRQDIYDHYNAIYSFS